MHLFVDESGVFANPDDKDHAVSTVSCLCVAEKRLAALRQGFGALKDGWGAGESEVKGSRLDEGQVQECLTLLHRHRARIVLAAVDVGLHDDAELEAHQAEQARRLTSSLTDEHHETLRAQLEDLQTRLAALPGQLYVQLKTLTAVVAKSIQDFTLLHVIEDPSELGNLSWVIDPKDKERTEYEVLWQTLVPPFLQSHSLQDPFVTMEGADYSAFERFELVRERRPARLPEMEPSQGRSFLGIDAKAVMQDLSYPPSEDDVGLQLADIVATTFRRSLRGTLQERGWQGLAPLLVPHSEGSVLFLAFHAASRQVTTPYGGIISWLNEKAAPLGSRAQFARIEGKVTDWGPTPRNSPCPCGSRLKYKRCCGRP